MVFWSYVGNAAKYSQFTMCSLALAYLRLGCVFTILWTVNKYHGYSIQIRPWKQSGIQHVSLCKKVKCFLSRWQKNRLYHIDIITVCATVLGIKHSVLQMASEQRHLRIGNLRQTYWGKMFRRVVSVRQYRRELEFWHVSLSVELLVLTHQISSSSRHTIQYTYMYILYRPINTFTYWYI